MRADVIWRSLFLSERTGAGHAKPGQEDSPDYLARFNKIDVKANHKNKAVQTYLDEIKSQINTGRGDVSAASQGVWLDELLNVLERYDQTNILREEESSVVPAPFHKALEPLATYFTARFADGCQKQNVFLSERCLVDFRFQLTKEISIIVGLTLYSHYSDETETPSQDAFEAWSSNVATRRWPEFVIKYPVMGRMLIERGGHIVTTALEIMAAYAADKESLHQRGLLKDVSAEVDTLEMTMSDYHNSGRTVCRLIFNDNSTLIYKPKSLANDQWFFDAFSRYQGGAFGQIPVLDRGHYGWAQDVLFRAEDVPSQLHKDNLAKAAALAYLMNGTDFHPENLLVTNDKVYFLDLETLMNGIVASEGEITPNDLTGFFSVLSTQVFKSQFSAEQRDKPIFDEGDAHLDLDKPVYYFRECPEEGIKLEIVGKKQDKTDVNIYEGLSERYESLDLALTKKSFTESCKALHQEFSASEAWKTIPADVYCRFVPRPTVFYARIFQRLYHPRFLRDAAFVSLELSGLILTLNTTRADVAEKWGLLIRDEIRQIQAGDIPYFLYNIHETALYSTSGLIDPDFIKIKAVTLFEEKIRRLKEGDIQDQSMLIEASLRYLSRQILGLSSHDRAEMDMEPGRSPERLRTLCLAIAEEIINSGSQKTEAETSWIGYTPGQADGSHIPTMKDRSFYSGYWGIMLYLNACEKVLSASGQNLISDFLDREAAHWKRNAGKALDSAVLLKETGIGGAAGYLKSLIGLYKFSPERWTFLIHEIPDFLTKLEADIGTRATGDVLLLEQNKNLYDFTWGECGLLSVLCDLDTLADFPVRGQAALQSLVKTIYASLIQNISVYVKGTSSSVWQAAPLVGFAHGNAGVIHSLTKCAQYFHRNQISSSQEALEGALDLLIAHDQSHFLNNNSTWIDKRNKVSEKVALAPSWCHGAPGVGLSRLALQRHEKYRQQASNDLGAAIVNVLNSQDLHTQSDFFCCGVAGQIDFLMEYLKAHSSQQVQDHKDFLLQGLLQRIGHRREFIGLMGEIPFNMWPGLFQGAAGIGYTFLRSLDPELPSLVL